MPLESRSTGGSGSIDLIRWQHVFSFLGSRLGDPLHLRLGSVGVGLAAGVAASLSDVRKVKPNRGTSQQVRARCNIGTQCGWSAADKGRTAHAFYIYYELIHLY